MPQNVVMTIAIAVVCVVFYMIIKNSWMRHYEENKEMYEMKFRGFHYENDEQIKKEMKDEADLKAKEDAPGEDTPDSYKE